MWKHGHQQKRKYMTATPSEDLAMAIGNMYSKLNFKKLGYAVHEIWEQTDTLITMLHIRAEAK